uniref:Ribonuclease VapC n=1 Tax=uncultured Thiotrichaceae bacterium TaxID=298394 RepID=A0A6S6ULX5_9GAMM|nr:MAG: Twitching motility protein PilT [uncultured Thiotrichaceae bacterium]
MKYLLDTCVISDFVKGDSNVHSRLKAERPSDLVVSSVTRMEIQCGLVLNPQRAKKITPIISSLLKVITVLPYEDNEAVATANIRAVLRQKGTPIGPYDVMIAGAALANQLIMVTSNTGEFKRVSGLVVEDWRLGEG